MIAHVTHILPLASIRRKRILPIKGTVLVRAGQKVTPTDIIAQADLTPEHIVLDIARGLGVSPNKAASYITREIGDEISEGSKVASRSGFASRVVRSPFPGRLVSISGGQVLIEIKNKPFQLKAGIPGSIASIEAERGAIIETNGAWIQGVWGNGKVDYGQLTILSKDLDHIVTPDGFDVSQRGTMMLGGYCNQAKALETAADVPIRGLILSSLAPKLISTAIKMPYPIIVLEGFDQVKMNSAAHTLLTTNESRELAINAESYNRFEGKRPEIVIPLQGAGDSPTPLNVETFTQGQKVRILRSPHASTVAKITFVQPGLTRFPSGLRAAAANVELEDGEKAVVPLANIEVLG
ncbi:MAG: hypothetical protein FVQ83_03075 [Chloroflexi bacterium]|nr:hypothetical protein [Chloroflexota bacterium]